MGYGMEEFVGMREMCGYERLFGLEVYDKVMYSDPKAERLACVCVSPVT